MKAAATFRVGLENAIAPLLPHGKARMDEIAYRLGMSRRTLARRLAAEDSPSPAVLIELRANFARRYLQDETCPFPRSHGCSATGRSAPSPTHSNAGPARRRDRHARKRMSRGPHPPCIFPKSDSGSTAAPYEAAAAGSDATPASAARNRAPHGRGCVSGIDFSLERCDVVDTVAGRNPGDDEIAPPPPAQHAAHVFPRHAGHGR